MAGCVVMWFRRDLRLADNPALLEAVRRGQVIPVALADGAVGEGARPRPGRPVELEALDPRSPLSLRAGQASSWWRRRSLAALDGDLRQRGSRLVVRCTPKVAAQGRSSGAEAADAVAEEVTRVAREAGARAVVWTRGEGPGETAEDGLVATALRAARIEPVLVRGAGLLAPPGSLLTAQGGPFKVFTPFWRALRREVEAGRPSPAPDRLPSPVPDELPSLAPDDLAPAPGGATAESPRWPKGVPAHRLSGETARPWAAGFEAEWQPGEAGARARLARLLDDVLPSYAEGRDRPDLALTSRLSPHLHHGELSARQLWAAVEAGDQGLDESTEAFLRQLAWREFAHHLLAAFPHTVVEPLRPEFARFPWRADPSALAAWQLGQTGYPFVDAGMRQLWQTGWMHNRSRLMVASFLVKDLLLPWQLGAAWFWDTLVDADLANNTLGWQWVAGSGADAAPYFRILNPVTQGRRFDPDGGYVRRYVPELGRLPGAWVHAPWQAPADVLTRAGVGLGETYPLPIVDHAEARRRALAAFDVVRGSARS